MTVKYIHIEKYDCNAYEKEKKPYAMILTDVIQKFPIERAKELLLWLFLESQCPTWKPNKHHVMKHFEISERTYERYMSWLNAVGLIEYRQERDPKGTFSHWKLVILSGTKFNPEAETHHTAKIGGLVVNRQKKGQIVQLIQSAKLPLNGDDRGTVETVERLDDGHINTNLHLEKKELLKKQNKDEKPVLVFFNSQDVKTHIESVSENKGQPLDEDTVLQILFYIGYNLDTNHVKKKINIALKIIKQGKWNIPQGYNGITSQSIREKEEAEQAAKQEQYNQEAQAFRAITNTVSQGQGLRSLKDVLNHLKGISGGKEADGGTMQAKAV